MSTLKNKLYGCINYKYIYIYTHINIKKYKIKYKMHHVIKITQIFPSNALSKSSNKAILSKRLPLLLSVRNKTLF